jgi:hypothetical protein
MRESSCYTTTRPKRRSFLVILALLTILLTTAQALDTPVAQVVLEVEVARREFGTYLIYPSPPEAASAPLASAPCPMSNYVIGPLLDAHDKPFRAWADVQFDRPTNRLFNGRHGVGFTVQIVWPDHPEALPPAELGANGELSFEGELSIAWAGKGPSYEVAPVAWHRGFESRPADATEHLQVLDSTAILDRAGRYGPYQWTIRGTLHAEVHVWGPPEAPAVTLPSAPP